MADRSVPGGLQTVAAALDLLDCFTEDAELGVTEVSRLLGVQKSTAHRLLTTLASRGIVEQNQRNAKYRLGLRLYELGNLAVTRFELRRSAGSLLEELREASGWTVQLSVASGVDSLVIERLQTLRSHKAMPEFHRRLPLHLTPHGKAMCAYNAALAQRRIDAGLPARTPNSITSVAGFTRELEEIRRTGYAKACEEAVLDIAAVGAPVLDVRGLAIAAVSINGPVAEIVPSFARLGRLVAAAAKRITRDLRTDVPS